MPGIAQQQHMGRARWRWLTLQPLRQSRGLPSCVATVWLLLHHHNEWGNGLGSLGGRGLAGGWTGDQQNWPALLMLTALQHKGLIKTVIAIKHYQPRGACSRRQ